MARHIFLTGEKQVGKSTLLRKLLEQETRPLGGFLTVKTSGGFAGRPTIHLLRAAKGEQPNPGNLLFFCGDPWTEEAARRFDQLGCAALKDGASAKRVVMDELGPAEAGAKAFQEEVFRTLDGGVPVLGVLQMAESPFLRQVANHPEVCVIEVTPENRGELSCFLEARFKAENSGI